jgi:effector protein SidI
MIKLYFTSALFQIPNTGDYDYMKELSSSLNNSKISSEILTKNVYGDDFIKIQEKYSNLLIKNVHNEKKFLKNYNLLKKDKRRINIITNIINYIKPHKFKYKVLAIQYRAPDSGTLFYPADLIKFKKEGIIIVTTCHEFYLNIYRPYLKKTTAHILSESNLTFFFNKIDFTEAQKYAFKGKHHFTEQLITLNLPNIKKTNKDILNRPNNILFFGLIRPKKGFESALNLALYIYNNPHKNIGKVIITGKCEYKNPTIQNWLGRLKSKLIDKNLNVHEKYKHVLKIYINKSNRSLSQIINICKYAYKPDGKGFANNSSSIINLLNFGCITYTKWGPFTPSYIINSNSKYKNSIRVQNSMNKDLMSDNKPLPNVVYDSIIKSTPEDNLKSITNSKKLLSNVFDNNVITSTYYKNILMWIKDNLRRN